ncbi:MAG: hypothetical protein NT047_11030 [Deltaproteobacteria bacterium]|nr:hypothetical protein [Deltaproteobacteria bacterium]
MMRVVDALPGKAEIAASGLVEKYFQTDPDAYRYFVEQYRRDFLDFKRRFYGNGGTADGSTDPGCTGRILTAADEACIEAFDQSRPPFYYHRGSLYRYRIDRTGPAERPIILDCYERSEVTGSVLGIPVYAQRQGLLMRVCLWIEKRLQERERKEKG